MNLPTPHLSVSQVKEYMSCPLKYKFDRVEQIPPEFVGSALVFGGSMHRAFAAYLSGRRHISDLMKVWLESWMDEVENGLTVVRFPKTETPSMQIERAERMLIQLTKDWKIEGEVLEVESEYFGNIGDIPVVGVIDAIQEHGWGREIIEFKTSSGKGIEMMEYSLQLGTYSLLSEIEASQVVQVTKAASPLIETQEWAATVWHRRTESIYRQVAESIEAERFYPIHGWHCQSCGWQLECRQWES